MPRYKLHDARRGLLLGLSFAIAAATMSCSTSKGPGTNLSSVGQGVQAGIVAEEIREGLRIKVTVTNRSEGTLFVCTSPHPSSQPGAPYQFLAQNQTLVLYWGIVHPLDDQAYGSHLLDLGAKGLHAEVRRLAPRESIALKVDFVSPITSNLPYEDILFEQGYREREVEKLRNNGKRVKYWEPVRRVCAVVGYWDKNTLLALGDVNEGGKVREYVKSGNQDGRVDGAMSVFALDDVSDKAFMQMILNCVKEPRLLEQNPGIIDLEMYATAGPIDLPPPVRS